MRKIGYTLVIVISGFLIVANPLTDQYMSLALNESISVSKVDDPLLIEIKEQAKTFEVPAEDAVIDRVWKAIPGLNGLKVDVNASYKKMKKDGSFDKEKLVFSEVKPKIHLEDLEPSPIYKGHPDKPMVSLLINVAWGNEYLPKMLETLKKHNVKATFFLEGRWTQNNPDLAKMIVAAGHEIGNHSYTHPDLKVASDQKTKEEIVKTNEVIEATTEQKVKWFAPPSGSYRNQTVNIANGQGLLTVMWTVDTIDWQKPSPETIINRVVNKVENGSMVLMHPTESTANALDRMIVGIKDKDLQIGTVTSLLSEERIGSHEKPKK